MQDFSLLLSQLSYHGVEECCHGIPYKSQGLARLDSAGVLYINQGSHILVYGRFKDHAVIG